MMTFLYIFCLYIGGAILFYYWMSKRAVLHEEEPLYALEMEEPSFQQDKEGKRKDYGEGEFRKAA